MKYWQYYFRVGIFTVITLCLSGCGGAPEPAQQESNSSGTTTSPLSGAEEEYQQSPTGEPDREEPKEIAPSSLPVAKVKLGGQITYDRVMFAERYYQGLDYDNIVTLPARGVSVQLRDQNKKVLATTQTDKDGYYQFTTNANTDVQVRVLAQLYGENAAVWDIQIRDNTAGDAQYIMDGSVINSGDRPAQTRNLRAPSGWNGDNYGDDRSAGPFAILDSLYDAVQMVIGAEPNIVLPPVTVYWSQKNIAISGKTRDGHIGTSYFTSSGPSIYLLGAADNDSDEYDRAVIQHEFGHYLEYFVGRSESVGGSHNQNSRLDMRVAFGEAWGNAFAGMASGDPLYRDSLGAKQSLGFTINVEARNHRNQGWFSEASVQAILYDLFDSQKDGGDDIELGFKPILDVLTSNAYQNFAGFASIFPFMAQLELQQPDHGQAIGTLLKDFNIHGKGWYGEGETNDGGSPTVLPLYHQIELDQTINVCSDSQYQDSNGLDVRRFIRIDLPTTRSYSIRAIKTAGLKRANPQFRIFKYGEQVDSVLNGTPDVEDALRYLSAGSYVFEVYEQSNADGNNSNGGLACFNITIE